MLKVELISNNQEDTFTMAWALMQEINLALEKVEIVRRPMEGPRTRYKVEVQEDKQAKVIDCKLVLEKLVER